MKSTVSILILFGAAALAQTTTDWAAIFRQHRGSGASGDPAMLGVTVWRMRPSRPSDDRNLRSLIHEPDAPAAEWTPERVRPESSLVEGDRVRISIEAGQTGFLYVLDQEAYAGGEIGDPVLIFPTSRTRGGDNKLVAGRFIDIPGQRDQPPYFRLKRSRAEHVGEVLSLIFTNSPLAEAVHLSKAQLADWSHHWGSAIETVRAAGGVEPITAGEYAAGSRDLLLEPNDPPPQTIYRVNRKSENSIFVQVALRIK
jgi:hypothetical protein